MYNFDYYCKRVALPVVTALYSSVVRTRYSMGFVIPFPRACKHMGLYLDTSAPPPPHVYGHVGEQSFFFTHSEKKIIRNSTSSESHIPHVLNITRTGMRF